MKLIITIVSNKDVGDVIDALGREGFFATKISTTGLFLENGHTCLFIGVKEEKLEEAINVLKGSVTKRVVHQEGVTSTLAGTLLNKPVDVEEFGGILFVIDVEKFVKF
ncbi:MAG: cyclic-di-AMP receptor [Clostridiales bacterium]|nr:cyclic-di-AMP receptor [Clostridiales bacterium]